MERVQGVVSLVFQFGVIISVLSQRDNVDRCLLGGLISSFFVVVLFSPSNGANGAGEPGP